MSVSRQVSVVICTRDRAEMLKRCLRSIAEGETRPMEVVLVDQSRNGCTEKAAQEIASQAQIPLRYVRLEGGGQTRARNAGVGVSRGEIIAFTDDDCVVSPDWIGIAEKELGDGRVTCMCGGSKPADHPDRPKQAMLSTLDRRKRTLARGRTNPITIGRGNNMAFRKDDLLRLGGFNESIGVGTAVSAGDDLDIFCRVLQAGGSILHAPDSVVFHSQPDEWKAVIRKKRGYSLSSAAVLAGRAWNGDLYAAGLLTGKVLYEFIYLFCGGLLRLNPRVTAIGWSSFLGSLSGVTRSFDPEYRREAHRLWQVAEEAKRNG